MTLARVEPERQGLQRLKVKVLGVDRPTPSLILIRLERPSGFQFKAGQFTYVFLADEDLKRPYSIASPPHDAGWLDLCVKKVTNGPGSTYLYGLEPGQTVEISRALGGFTFKTPPGMPVAFLCTGTGVAPFRAMAHQLLHDGDDRDLWLFEGSRDERNLPYVTEFYALATRHENFHFVPVLSGGPVFWAGDRGWIQEAFIKRFHARRDYEAYICGIKRMVDDVRLLLHERGVPPAAIHVERYD